jgi:hypothetical protein
MLSSKISLMSGMWMHLGIVKLMLSGRVGMRTSARRKESIRRKRSENMERISGTMSLRIYFYCMVTVRALNINS